MQFSKAHSSPSDVATWNVKQLSIDVASCRVENGL